MSNKKQYYTPDISEFHVGFEYEEKTEVLGGHVWELLGFDVDIGYDSLSYLIERDMVRVAYLTPKQIESRGWELHNDQEEEYLEYRKPYKGENLFINISAEPFEQGTYVNITKDGLNYVKYFEGYIKNINEFDRLCKQLGITE